MDGRMNPKCRKHSLSKTYLLNLIPTEPVRGFKTGIAVQFVQDMFLITFCTSLLLRRGGIREMIPVSV